MNESDLSTLKNISRLFDFTIDFLLECDEADNSATPIELLSLIRNGIFTVNGKFLTQKEREKILNIIKILYEV